MRIEVLGDAALVLHFGATIDPAINGRVLAFAGTIGAAGLPGLRDLVPAYASLTLCYDPAIWGAAELAACLAALPRAAVPAPDACACVEIPVCYAPEFAPDLALMCAHTGLDAQEFVKPEIDWTAEETWPVLMNWSRDERPPEPGGPGAQTRMMA